MAASSSATSIASSSDIGPSASRVTSRCTPGSSGSRLPSTS